MTMKLGDFTGLAEKYSKYRPDYSESVLRAMLGLHDKPVTELVCADVGAGTGIWSRMLQDTGVKSITAVEPNEDMRRMGLEFLTGASTQWLDGSAENTGLDDSSCDLVTMASSFHWANFDNAIAEFHRVLKPGGRFCALWNPRLITDNPMLVEIESFLTNLNPDIKRVSSGKSGITENLREMLEGTSEFDDVVYLEGKHIIKMTPDRYIGAWESVNDLAVQLGQEKFQIFMDHVKEVVAKVDYIEATYLTRAWSAARVGS